MSDATRLSSLGIPRARWDLLAFLLLVSGSAGVGCTKTAPPSDKAVEPSPAATPIASAAKTKQEARPASLSVLPPGTLRVDLGSRPPAGIKLAGWSRANDEGRRIAKLTAPSGIVTFDLAPTAAHYALAGVARVDGSQKATLTPSLNGQALSPWSLTSDWGMFSSPIPKALLDAPRDELAFAGAQKPPIEISFDTLALVPASDRAVVQMGQETTGLLIDGFYNVERGTLRWSRGRRSVLGVVLAPSNAQYRLTVRGASSRHVMPLSVTARVNGRDLGAVEFSNRMSDKSWVVPSGLLVSGVNRIELSYARTAKPSDFGTSKDTRVIALRIAQFELAPAG